MADLFVSYSRRDSSFVTKVVGQLDAAGISVWMDVEGIEAGDRWKTAITQAVDQARWCMLVLSPRSMESRQVAAEVNMAFDKQRPIIPIVFEECDIHPDLAYALSGVHHVDFTGSFDDGMTGLLRALGTTDPGQRFHRKVFDDNETDARVVGRGITFPLRFDSTGAVTMSDRGDAIDESLLMIMRTIPGERIGRPDYGCDIWDLAFERLDERTLRQMGDRVRDAIHRWEPRAEELTVDVSFGGMALGAVLRQVRVTIEYTVRGTSERREYSDLIGLM